jgi:hypothetical protein
MCHCRWQSSGGIPAQIWRPLLETAFTDANALTVLRSSMENTMWPTRRKLRTVVARLTAPMKSDRLGPKAMCQLGENDDHPSLSMKSGVVSRSTLSQGDSPLEMTFPAAEGPHADVMRRQECTVAPPSLRGALATEQSRVFPWRQSGLFRCAGNDGVRSGGSANLPMIDAQLATVTPPKYMRPSPGELAKAA